MKAWSGRNDRGDIYTHDQCRHISKVLVELDTMTSGVVHIMCAILQSLSDVFVVINMKFIAVKPRTSHLHRRPATCAVATLQPGAIRFRLVVGIFRRSCISMYQHCSFSSSLQAVN